ncbi:hypothetical protein OIU34_19600 [Pararhizobium sp. BT-229]|uniref:hypothetical protein n=1 Tax=Pararhizobium sp. BT-229 TaxID=2986923 RepID=UPI0021F6D50C|nr:hypothetical protein [Pararhizobium sp. BT-229]MCV9964090.1 hypothetical protein [Pararhizobium sp. BT-229]
MTQYQIVVIADGDSPYCEGNPSSRDEAFEAVKAMQAATMYENGQEKFVFDYEDDILIIDPEGSVIYAWNRDEPRDVAAYADFKISGTGTRKLLGWQIVDADGLNIHGEENDPFGLASFEILSGDAVEQARAWVAENPGYKVVEAFAGDIEEPSVISRLPGRASTPTAKPAP